jgi:ABC-type nitrate/sulfonate/bicarbonate transport system permease component
MCSLHRSAGRLTAGLCQPIIPLSRAGSLSPRGDQRSSDRHGERMDQVMGRAIPIPPLQASPPALVDGRSAEPRGRNSWQTRPLRFSWRALLAMLVVWETLAWILKWLTRYADTILPTWEGVLFRALPSFGILWMGPGGGVASYGGAAEVLLQHSLYTLSRVLGGALIGILLGLAVGLALGWDRRIRGLLWPTLQVLRPVPHMAIIPLFMVWFGGRETGVWIYIVWAIFSMMVVYVVEAVRNSPPLLKDFARTQGATNFQVYWTVVLPWIVPSLIGGIRVALGVSWAISLGGEFIGTQYGLGRLLILSQTFLDSGRMVVIAVLYIIYGFAINKLVVLIADRWTRWVPRVNGTA